MRDLAISKNFIHTEWIYRNVVVHDKTTGTLVSEYKLELQKEIDELTFHTEPIEPRQDLVN